MTYRVLTIDEKEEWSVLLEKLPIDQQDIYYTPDYYELYEKNGDGRALCFAFQKNDDIALYPFLMNSVNDLGYDFKLTHDGISCETRKRDDSEISKIEKLALEKSSCKDDYIYKLDNPEKDVEDK